MPVGTGWFCVRNAWLMPPMTTDGALTGSWPATTRPVPSGPHLRSTWSSTRTIWPIPIPTAAAWPYLSQGIRQPDHRAVLNVHPLEALQQGNGYWVRSQHLGDRSLQYACQKLSRCRGEASSPSAACSANKFSFWKSSVISVSAPPARLSPGDGKKREHPPARPVRTRRILPLR